MISRSMPGDDEQLGHFRAIACFFRKTGFHFSQHALEHATKNWIPLFLNLNLPTKFRRWLGEDARHAERVVGQSVSLETLSDT
jgi:hypothetical protein